MITSISTEVTRKNGRTVRYLSVQIVRPNDDDVRTVFYHRTITHHTGASMKKDDIFPIAVTVFILAIVLIGEAIVITDSHDDFHSSVSVDGDRVSFSIESDNAHTYSVLSLSDTLDPPKDISVYYDPEYESAAGIGSYSVGGKVLDTGYYVQQIAPNFMVRGINDIDIVDSAELKDIMSAEGKEHTVIVVSGALPDTVYDGTSDSMVLKWLDSGGRLYWIGNVLGKYISHVDSLEEVTNGTSLFLGSECIDDEIHAGEIAVDTNGFRDSLFLQNNETTYAIRTSELPSGTVYQTMGYTDGTRASITMVEHGDGTLCVIGGNYNFFQRLDLAQIVASGVGAETTIVDKAVGSVSGKATGTVSAGDSVIVNLGGFYTVYSETYEVVA